jgi:hypothetical protein
LGRNIRSAELDFFRQRMSEHSCVKSCTPLDNQDEYVYLITREHDLPDVQVHLTDAYQYSRAWYLVRPKEVRKRNSFVVGNSFTPSAPCELVDEARDAGIGIGNIAKLMGALNSRNVWEYQAPDERSKLAEERFKPPWGRARSERRWSSTSSEYDPD